MSDETKTPQPGEWWSDAGEIVFVIGRNSAGHLTYERDGIIEEMDDESELITWHHEPRCDSFDWVQPPAETVHTIDVNPGDGYRWLEDDEIVTPTDEVFRPDLSPCWVKPLTRVGSAVNEFGSDDYPIRRSIARTQPVEPPAIDPGEGWELLPVGTVLQDGDEFLEGETWIPTGNAKKDTVNWNTYRRKIKPAEDVLPRFFIYTGSNPCDWDYVKVTKWGTSPMMHMDGIMRPYSFIPSRNEVEEWVRNGWWKEVTEAEALARVTPPEPVESPDDWVEITDPGHVLRKGIDQVLESGFSTHRWAVVALSEGIKAGQSGYVACRCRRKDLPAKQPATKRVPVRLYWYDGNIVGRYEHSQPTDESFVEIHSDCDGGWYVIGGSNER